MARELFVRHISANATDEDLFKLFSVCGTVNSVHLVTDPDTGKLTGCGFVRMASDEETKDAQETLDGALLVDRVIIVAEARPQKPQLKPGGKRPGGFGKGRPAGGNRERPAGGERERPVSGDRERPVSAGKSRPAGGSREKAAGGDRERPIGGGKSRPAGGREKPTGGGKDRPTGRGRK